MACALAFAVSLFFFSSILGIRLAHTLNTFIFFVVDVVIFAAVVVVVAAVVLVVQVVCHHYHLLGLVMQLQVIIPL